MASTVLVAARFSDWIILSGPAMPCPDCGKKVTQLSGYWSSTTPLLCSDCRVKRDSD